MKKKSENKIQPRRLDSLFLGEEAVIHSIEPSSASERLSEMGVVKGEKVTLMRIAPLGDPLLIKVLDAPLAVRRVDLASVWVI